LRKTAIFFLILLLPFRIPLVNSAPDEGYGEANENLGQFTDSFENTDNITVMVNVINNVTLECMELYYSGEESPIYQNFSKYTEVDSAADITIIDRVVTWATMRRDAISWVVYDFGADYFGDFYCDFTLDFSDIEAGDTSNRHIMGLCSFSNTVGTFADNLGGDMLIIMPRQYSLVDDVYRYDVYQYTGGVLDFSISDDTNYDMSKHYLTFGRIGNNITLKVYTDEARTVLIETLTDTGSTQKYRYFHVMTSYDSAADGANHSSGTVSHVSFEKTEGGYATEGYFLTEDYLNYTQGSSLNLLTNASLPESSEITVEFSSDNVTWVDNHGNVGSSTVEAGFFAIDLRDLNYSDIFIRGNLSGPGGEVTPRLYQLRIVTTNGSAMGAPGPGVTVIESDAPWIALAIILSIIAFLLATRIKR